MTFDLLIIAQSIKYEFRKCCRVYHVLRIRLYQVYSCENSPKLVRLEGIVVGFKI